MSDVMKSIMNGWAEKRAEEAKTMCAKRSPTEEEVDRAMIIGKWFNGWNEKTGPCPISMRDEHWGKRLCALFEWISVLETDVQDLKDEIRVRSEVVVVD